MTSNRSERARTIADLITEMEELWPRRRESKDYSRRYFNAMHRVAFAIQNADLEAVRIGDAVYVVNGGVQCYRNIPDATTVQALSDAERDRWGWRQSLKRD